MLVKRPPTSHLLSHLGSTAVSPACVLFPPTPNKAQARPLKASTLASPKSSNGAAPKAKDSGSKGRIKIHGVHHVALLCEDLERSMHFYTKVLGLDINPDRPHDKLPYRGEWLQIGSEMIHLMELPNPDPLNGRPTHGGRDRHFCIGVDSIEPLEARLKVRVLCACGFLVCGVAKHPLEARLKEHGIEYTCSMSGRPAVFFRDPDMNCLECVEQGPWR